ncbi:uncharacterized protein LOC129223185 [Uloborus diversus]|uniref:uncharacterized protein LOC129223185 n=1 Tax=Uloborus diversus TaxID=327109 RepID=UPI00240951B5|nr:uncharacterized protein LOC129223185 [Uloborus diversus]
MKRVKCYGRVKKSVALEKPVVKDFFGEEDYKTSLWDFDSLKKDDKEKESKPVKRAGRKKMSSQRYFFPSSPDMFTSSSCDSKIKLTNKKGQRAKKEKNNKNIPESNKINLRKRLRDKNNEIDIYDAEIQPKWSEIEDHDLCLETYKRYEKSNIKGT